MAGTVTPMQTYDDESTSDWTSPTQAADVTDEMVEIAREIVDGWYQEGRVDWEDVWDRMDGAELADGTHLDLGTDLGTPALAKLKRLARR
jgi:hypothetical protein